MSCFCLTLKVVLEDSAFWWALCLNKIRCYDICIKNDNKFDWPGVCDKDCAQEGFQLARGKLDWVDEGVSEGIGVVCCKIIIWDEELEVVHLSSSRIGWNAWCIYGLQSLWKSKLRGRVKRYSRRRWEGLRDLYAMLVE